MSQQLNFKHVGISDILNKLNNNVYNTFSDMLKEHVLNPSRQFALATVVIDPTDESKFLAVKRPHQAKSLPGVWGLPAVVIERYEELEVTVARLAWEKLNTQVELIGCLDFASIDREKYTLTLMEVVVKLVGKEPSVWEASTEQTKYVHQQWTNDLSILQEAALKGSVCSRILLGSFGITY